MCAVFKNWVLLCWHSWLLYNCNSKWSSDSVMIIWFLFFCCSYSTIIIILAHSCFYPCLSEMFFKNYLFCNKLRRSVKFQHAINPSGPDLFQCKPLMFRLSFTESCMISTRRTYRNCLNLSNHDTGQDTYPSFLFCSACFLKRNKDTMQICGALLLLDDKVSSVEKHLFISLIS